MIFSRCNVCHGGTQSAFGCHESYGHQVNPELLAQQIVPHLVSRLIYTGAGGFSNRSPGLEFTLSPRVAHLVKESSSASTSGRGIFHTRDESLSGPGYSRLHLLCGESLCSETATWLKMGTTALVVAMIEAGLQPGDGVRLRAPVDAMRRFAADVTCQAAVAGAAGSLTAVAIQRHYLRLAEDHLHDSFMPPWAEEVCVCWRAILTQLEQDPETLATVLDWPIKLSLYRDRCWRAGIAWKSLSDWTEVLVRCNSALQARDVDATAQRLGMALLGPASPIAEEVAELTPWLKDRGLDWSGLERFLALRHQLLEIDMRFGQLGNRGIFTALDRAGVLAHRMSGVDRIEEAMTEPPAVGRARLRGQGIRRLTGNDGRYVCDWTGIWDRKLGRFLDLTDPFAAEESWIDLQPQKS